MATTKVLDELSVQHEGRSDPAAVSKPAKPASQLPLFTEYVSHPAVDRLKEIKLDALSPMQAFDLLRELARDARS